MRLTVLTLASLLVSASARARDMVWEDWYFRESLRAIRDWEEILAREDTPQGVPVLPVPHDGSVATWPNPIPALLLPAEDRNLTVGVRCADGKIGIRRRDRADQMISETLNGDADVVAYCHPGGTAKERWYQQCNRAFDRLTTFRPRPAPFALSLDAPADFRRGVNQLSLELRNASSRPLALDVELRFSQPQRSRVRGRRSVTLPVAGTVSVQFPVELSASGGGLLLLSIQQDDELYWLPLLTHVEDVDSMLRGIDRILADTPHPAAARRLAALRRRVRAWQPTDVDSGRHWSAVFEESNRLRDELLLSRIHFGSLLFVKRKPFISDQPFMDAHHLINRPGGGIYRLEPPGQSGKVTPVVDSLGQGIYRDLCLNWDASRFLFAFGNGSDAWDGSQSYHVYEARADGTRLRQLTWGPKNDCEPFYLPDGRIGFTSDRSEHFVMCGGNRHAPNLFVMNGDGAGLRQFGFNAFNEFTPSMLSDGRIVFGRWEYNERSVTALHKPFTVRPDGTMVAPYYGNATIRPNVVMFVRSVPDSQKVMALFTAHHGQTHGAVGLIDVRRGADGDAPLTILTPNVPVAGEAAEDSRGGWFSDPLPLSENAWLCVHTPTALPWMESTWAIYLADRHGHLALVHRSPDISCAEPVPLAPRQRPPVLASTRSKDDADATLVLADVYAGMPEVPRGTAKSLRIIEDVPRESVHDGHVICTSGTPIYTVKRVLGTVPVEDDGSAHFVVPANRNLYFQVLDSAQREVQRMRSVVCLAPGETRGCVGCHEPRSATPPGSAARTVRQALTREASRLQPPPWGPQIVSFLRDVQPVLNVRCVACHTHDRRASRVILTDDLTDQFTIGYEELLPYLSVGNSKRWDWPADVYARPAYTYGSNASRLTRLLDAGHHGVRLTDEEWQRLVNWIDANGVYYDRYEISRPDRRIFDPDLRSKLDEIYSRRCAPCHLKVGLEAEQMSVNWRDVRRTRMLAAPLAQSAGGWGCCDGGAFADTTDPDYRESLRIFTAIRDSLEKTPREDLLSIRGTAAEHQTVQLAAHPRDGRAKHVLGRVALALASGGLLRIFSPVRRRWSRARRRHAAPPDTLSP